MNYAYLYINHQEEPDKTDLFDQLKKSIEILKDKDPTHGSIHIFADCQYPELLSYCRDQGLFLRSIRYNKKYGGILDILVEKINLLKNFNNEQEITLLDIDTACIQNIPENFWKPDHAVLWHAEYYITQFRNLDKVLPTLPLKQLGIDFDQSFIMYNTGVIYIPKNQRQLICETALEIVEILNSDDYDVEFRYGNKLDEQIGLSLAIHQHYSKENKIILCKDYIYHYWEEKTKNIKWWK
jgi:hypothetical protein